MMGVIKESAIVVLLPKNKMHLNMISVSTFAFFLIVANSYTAAFGDNQ